MSYGYSYVWTAVEVLEYDPKTQKFKVRIGESGVEKWIGRLSVMFLWEDQIKFQERVELAKQRQRNADDELRFKNYVDKQSDKVASTIQSELKNKIIQYAEQRPLPYKTKKEDQKLAAPGFPQM